MYNIECGHSIALTEGDTVRETGKCPQCDALMSTYDRVKVATLGNGFRMEEEWYLSVTTMKDGKEKINGTPGCFATVYFPVVRSDDVLDAYRRLYEEEIKLGVEGAMLVVTWHRGRVPQNEGVFQTRMKDPGFATPVGNCVANPALKEIAEARLRLWIESR